MAVLPRNSSMRNPNVTFIYDDIVHVLQNTNLSGSLQEFHHGIIKLAVKFENNIE